MVALPEIVAFVVLVLLALAEWLHARRVRNIAALAFGHTRSPRTWTHAAPALRVLAGMLMAWSLTTLYFEKPKTFKAKEAAPNQQKHVIIVLDVSPSMKLEDAGTDGKMKRSKRASELMHSFFQRVPMEMVKLSLVATYTEAKPVVVDTRDVGVIQNIMDGLPLSHAFPSGKTNLFSGIQEAARIATPWERDSTTVLVLSDGDSIPPTGMPRMPISIKDVVLAGVGDSRAGKFINGHQSRQEAASLQQIAVRLRGTYHDGNSHQLPTDLLRKITALPEAGIFEKLSRREYALAALVTGAVIYSSLPWLLLLLGTAWRPGVRTDSVRSISKLTQLQTNN
jgi:Ca-activated chloride channel family protein